MKWNVTVQNSRFYEKECRVKKLLWKKYVHFYCELFILTVLYNVYNIFSYWISEFGITKDERTTWSQNYKHKHTASYFAIHTSPLPSCITKPANPWAKTTLTDIWPTTRSADHTAQSLQVGILALINDFLPAKRVLSGVVHVQEAVLVFILVVYLVD